MRRGTLVVADCCPARDPALARAQHGQWRAHLRDRYSAAQARAFLEAWKHEDTYMPLEIEMAMMRKAGLLPEVIWRATRLPWWLPGKAEAARHCLASRNWAFSGRYAQGAV